MNTYLKYQSPAMQFLAFLGLASGFLIMSVIVNSFFFRDMSAVLQDASITVTPELIGRFKVAQVVGTFITFIIPAALFAYFSAPRPFAYAGLHNTFSPLLIVLSILLLFAVQPFAGWLGEINSNVHFGAMHEALKKSEETYTRLMETFLKMGTTSELVINLFVMALLPAIAEELYFRGALQKVLLRWNKKPWLSILLSSMVFAFLHGTFFKLLPIFALGIMLGTVYYVTRNLWYCILIHFANNAMAVLAVYYSSKNEMVKKFASDEMNLPIYMAVISLAFTIGIIYYLKKESDRVLPAYTVADDNDLIA